MLSVLGACQCAENVGKCAEAKRRVDSAKPNPKGAQASARLVVNFRIGSTVGSVLPTNPTSTPRILHGVINNFFLPDGRSGIKSLDLI